MGQVVADGSVLSLGTLGTLKAVSAITNASSAVATLEASHGVIVGDILQFTSGWPDLDGKVVRISAVSTNDVTLEGFDTTDTTKFPPGSGTGSIKEVTGWTNIAQILTIGKAGGEQQYYNFQFLNELQGRQIPTSKNPLAIEMKLADDITLAQNATIRAAEDSGVPQPFRLVYRNGSRTLASGYWSMAYLPDLALGQANQRDVSIALSCLPQDYAT